MKHAEAILIREKLYADLLAKAENAVFDAQTALERRKGLGFSKYALQRDNQYLALKKAVETAQAARDLIARFCRQ